MENVLAFRRAARPAICPTINAANHAAAATNAFCEARRDLMAGHSREAVARTIVEAGALRGLVIAAIHTIELTGDQPRDRALRAALDGWLHED